jgi:hypothetical protein
MAGAPGRTDSGATGKGIFIAPVAVFDDTTPLTPAPAPASSPLLAGNSLRAGRGVREEASTFFAPAGAAGPTLG